MHSTAGCRLHSPLRHRCELGISASVTLCTLFRQLVLNGWNLGARIPQVRDKSDGLHAACLC